MKKKKSVKKIGKKRKTKSKSAKKIGGSASSGKKIPMASLLLPLDKVKDVFRTRYGFFLYDGSEYVITAPESPAPWANIITNDNYGFVVTQTGGGFSFRKTISDRTTKWSGNTNTDRDGKFFYIRDNKTQEYWSAAWNPVCKKPEFYEVRYGVGYTNITNKYAGIISSLICFTAAEAPVEIWQLRLKNENDESKNISVFSYLQWDFQNNKKGTFLKTSFDEELSAVFAHTDKDDVLFHSVDKEVASFTTDAKAFLGIYRETSAPRAVEKGMCFKEQGRYVEPAACLQVDLDLQPGAECELIFVIGAAAHMKNAQELIKRYKKIKEVETEFSKMGSRWGEYLKKSMSIKTPDEGANILNNNWFRYQAISSGLAAKGCYYKPEGEISFKDFLLNSLIFLPIDSKICRDNILKSAKNQFRDGNVLTSWNPLTEKSEVSNYSDDPLWLVFAVIEYLKETADFSILKEKAPYLDAQPEVLLQHCLKILDRVLETAPKKGLPAIMKGDCNRKLDKVGVGTKGYSVWLGQFLCYLLDGFSDVCAIVKEEKIATTLIKRSKQIKANINKLAKENDWYPRAITTRGAIIGKSGSKNSTIFLNPQSWAVISGLLEDDDGKKIMDIVAKHLYKNHGPITLSPSYETQDPNIGTLSSLPPGIAENGGTNIEFACWAAWAETILGRAYTAWDIYSRLNPVHRAHRADIYEMEPFVASTYIDGPDAAKFGQARNSWYGVSAFWLNKILTEHILGIKPTYNGLVIDPCIPKRWRLFKVSRSFRGTRYIIDVVNHRHVSSGVSEMMVDGKKVKSNILPIFRDDKNHYARIVMGRPHA